MYYLYPKVSKFTEIQDTNFDHLFISKENRSFGKFILRLLQVLDKTINSQRTILSNYIWLQKDIP